MMLGEIQEHLKMKGEIDPGFVPCVLRRRERFAPDGTRSTAHSGSARWRLHPQAKKS
jgi:hypothetical protein